MKVLVVYNPTAGGGKEALLQQFVDALKKRGATVEVYRTKYAGDATVYLKNLEDQGDCVVAVGGDGTTNEVINGIKPSVPLGLFATGTANVLVKELMLPKKADLAAEIIVHGHTLNIWPSRLNNHRFCMMVGIGYDAEVVHGADMVLKQKLARALMRCR